MLKLTRNVARSQRDAVTRRTQARPLVRPHPNLHDFRFQSEQQQDKQQLVG